jgi:hypothetical protein
MTILLVGAEPVSDGAEMPSVNVRLFPVPFSALLVLASLAAQGCCNTTAYKQATQDDAKHHVEYARGMKDCQTDAAGKYSDDCMMSWAMPLSGLECLVDEDTGASKPDGKTRACKCAKPISADDRATACTDWMKNGN